MYETIEQWLKEEHTGDRRVTCGGNWLYYDNSIQEFIVVYRPYRAKYNRSLYMGNDLNLALIALKGERNDNES